MNTTSTTPVPAQTPEPPYFAVIFTSLRSGKDSAYDVTAAEMLELASQQPGFLGVDSARGSDGLGITVSYWENSDAISQWKAVAAHRAAQSLGRERWYSHYEVRITRVERAYGFHQS